MTPLIDRFLLQNVDLLIYWFDSLIHLLFYWFIGVLVYWFIGYLAGSSLRESLQEYFPCRRCSGALFRETFSLKPFPWNLSANKFMKAGLSLVNPISFKKHEAACWLIPDKFGFGLGGWGCAGPTIIKKTANASVSVQFLKQSLKHLVDMKFSINSIIGKLIELFC